MQSSRFELPSRTRVTAPQVLLGPARVRRKIFEARREGRHLLVLDRVKQVPERAGRAALTEGRRATSPGMCEGGRTRCR